MQVDNDFRWDGCPLCGSDDIRGLGPADYQGGVKYSTRDIDLCHRPEIWQCESCKSGFTQNIVPEDISRSLYSSSRAAERWSNTPFLRDKTPEVVVTMQNHFKTGASVLDVGCNTGELLDYAKTLGCQTTGLEYSSDSREIIRNKGHSAYQSIDELDRQFGLITAFDLVEHLYDVNGFLAACHEKLDSGGKLILLTGDIQSRSASRAGQHWWYLQYPEHIVFPSRRYFEGRDGFSLEAWIPTYAAIGYVVPGLRILLSRIKSRLTGRCYNGLPSISPDHALIVLTRQTSKP